MYFIFYCLLFWNVLWYFSIYYNISIISNILITFTNNCFWYSLFYVWCSLFTFWCYYHILLYYNNFHYWCLLLCLYVIIICIYNILIFCALLFYTLNMYCLWFNIHYVMLVFIHHIYSNIPYFILVSSVLNILIQQICDQKMFISR